MLPTSEDKGFQVQLLTGAELIARMFEHSFDGNNIEEEFWEEFIRLNPEIKQLIDKIGNNLGDLYQAIGNAKPWV